MKKYIRKDDEIIRTKDDKVVATIDQEGKVTPTAPVYYKIIEEIEEVANGTKKEEKPLIDKLIEEAPEIEAPKQTKETVTTFKLVNIPQKHPQIPAAANHLWNLYKSMDGMKEAHKWEVLGRVALGMSLPEDQPQAIRLPEGGPERSAALGSRTKGYPTWLVSVDPDLAKTLYAGRNCPEYDEAIKNL